MGSLSSEPSLPEERLSPAKFPGLFSIRQCGTSYIDYCRDNKGAYCVKAKQFIAKGTRLAEWDERDCPQFEASQTFALKFRIKDHGYSFEVEFAACVYGSPELVDGKIVYVLEKYKCLANHSCNPNLRDIIGDDGEYNTVALHDIQKDEELTFDYNLEYYKLKKPFRCVCGDDCCLGYVGGFSALDQGQKHEKMEYATHFVKEMYKREHCRYDPCTDCTASAKFLFLRQKKGLD
jgi:hypothetical protein